RWTPSPWTPSSPTTSVGTSTASSATRPTSTTVTPPPTDHPPGPTPGPATTPTKGHHDHLRQAPDRPPRRPRSRRRRMADRWGCYALATADGQFLITDGDAGLPDNADPHMQALVCEYDEEGTEEVAYREFRQFGTPDHLAEAIAAWITSRP